jgi:hypothetical protein
MLRMLAWGVVAALLLGACDSGEPAAAPAERLPEDALECPNEADAREDASLREPGRLEGDVDGDGESDVVHLVVDPGAEPGCQAFVVADTAGGFRSAPIWEAGAEMSVGRPRLLGIAEINGAPGADVIVEELVGASTQFAGVLVVEDGSLVRLTRPETGGGSVASVQHLFAYGGSVGHLEAVDCLGEGRVVTSVAVPDLRPADTEDMYEVTRVVLAAEGAALSVVERERTRVAATELQTLPEYRGSPFGSCPVPGD